MRSRELRAARTPVTEPELVHGLALAWCDLFYEVPSAQVLTLLCAHVALECGRGRYLECYNFGNVKARAGGAYDYCYRECNEVLSSQLAAGYVASASRRIEGEPGPDAVDEGEVADGRRRVRFYARHPVSCFRAFETLQAGALDHVRFLAQPRYAQARLALAAGDPAAYCLALRAAGYMTAPLEGYTKSVSSLYAEYTRKGLATKALAALTRPAAPQLPDPPATSPSLPRPGGALPRAWQWVAEALREHFKPERREP